MKKLKFITGLLFLSWIYIIFLSYIIGTKESEISNFKEKIHGGSVCTFNTGNNYGGAHEKYIHYLDSLTWAEQDKSRSSMAISPTTTLTDSKGNYTITTIYHK